MTDKSTQIAVKSKSKVIVSDKLPVISDLKPLQTPKPTQSDKNVGKSYKFLTRRLNPDYEKGLKTAKVGKELQNRIKSKIDRKTARENAKNMLCSDSCLLHANSHSKPLEKIPKIWSSILAGKVQIKTEPKWLTDLLETKYDIETGEQLETGVYSTNEFKSQTGRKIHTLEKFFSKYEPLKRKGEVQMYFLTFTRATYSRLLWHEMIHNIKARFEAKGLNIRGYVWTAEVGEPNQKYKDYNGQERKTISQWHYHLIIAVNQRYWFKKIPRWAKFESVWGQRTQIKPVTTDGLTMYLSTYLAKCHYRVVNTRAKGQSIKYE